MPANGHQMLFHTADGRFLLVLWNDERLSGPVRNHTIAVPPVPVTLTLAEPARSIETIDLLGGPMALRKQADIRTIDLSLLDHPIVIAIRPGTAIAAGYGASAVN